MKQRRRMQLIISAFAILSVIIVAAGAIILIGKNRLEEYQAHINELEQDKMMTTYSAYVALTDIVAGERLSENVNVVFQPIRTGLAHEIYATGEEMGYKALVDIPMGTAVEKNMVGLQNITKDAREYEVREVTMMVNQQDHDVVDVRIWFPDGSDYIILAKKEMYNYVPGSATFDMMMNEEEIQRIRSGIVDAYLNGGKLYTTKYMQTTLQEAAEEYYPVSETVMQMIQYGDPNILTKASNTLNAEARADLERRLNNLSESAVDAVTARTGAGQVLTEEGSGSGSAGNNNGFNYYDAPYQTNYGSDNSSSSYSYSSYNDLTNNNTSNATDVTYETSVYDETPVTPAVGDEVITAEDVSSTSEGGQ